MVRADRFDATHEEARANFFLPIDRDCRPRILFTDLNRSKENSGDEGIEETWSVVWSR